MTLETVRSDSGDRIIPRGTKGTVVECYSEPCEGYAVDLEIPADSLVGGLTFENVILYPHQFDLLPDGPSS